MIVTIKNKGLQELFTKGKTKHLPQERLNKIKKLLFLLHSAHQLEDLNAPGLRLHPLKAPPYIGYYSIDVTGNYRLVFKFHNGNAHDVDYVDTH
jgi:toxin HigB-1